MQYTTVQFAHPVQTSRVIQPPTSLATEASHGQIRLDEALLLMLVSCFSFRFLDWTGWTELDCWMDGYFLLRTGFLDYTNKQYSSA